jgi:hypothetical protein
VTEPPILAYVLEFAEGRPSPDALAWLKTGFRGWLDGEADLPAALGLNAVHSRGARYAVARAAMLQHLRQAASLIGEPDPWRNAKALSDAIQAFRRYRWPKLRNLDTIPAHTLTDIERELLDAFRVMNGKVPESPQQLHELL